MTLGTFNPTLFSSTSFAGSSSSDEVSALLNAILVITYSLCQTGSAVELLGFSICQCRSAVTGNVVADGFLFDALVPKG